jgi:hypothetical protein
MADHPPNSNNTGTPRWVKMFGLGALVLTLFIILHLVIGGGFHGHTL